MTLTYTEAKNWVNDGTRRAAVNGDETPNRVVHKHLIHLLTTQEGSAEYIKAVPNVIIDKECAFILCDELRKAPRLKDSEIHESSKWRTRLENSRDLIARLKTHLEFGTGYKRERMDWIASYIGNLKTATDAGTAHGRRDIATTLWNQFKELREQFESRQLIT